MAGLMVGPLLDLFPVEQVKTYSEPNGEFPDHEPNPLLPENRRFIIDKVRETTADLGIAWDGDADRCFFIDDAGEFVAGDFLAALLGSRSCARSRARGSSTTCAPHAPWRARAVRPRSTASAMRLQDPDA
jgi:phosphomannomutase